MSAWHFRQVAYAVVKHKVRRRDYAVGLLREKARSGEVEPPSMAEIARALGLSRAAVSKQYGGGSNRAEAAYATVRSALNRAAQLKPMRYSPQNPLDVRGELEEAVRRVLVPPELVQFFGRDEGRAQASGTQEVH
ncbi:MAG: hypothetical protein KAG72_10325 [Abyssibacter sp.]|nr:hypothetical protein [Abyssibacter sp.]MCK5859730.1 hypothetical protein [Abyssibacter sp.]